MAVYEPSAPLESGARTSFLAMGGRPCLVSDARDAVPICGSIREERYECADESTPCAMTLEETPDVMTWYAHWQQISVVEDLASACGLDVTGSVLCGAYRPDHHKMPDGPFWRFDGDFQGSNVVLSPPDGLAMTREGVLHEVVTGKNIEHPTSSVVYKDWTSLGPVDRTQAPVLLDRTWHTPNDAELVHYEPPEPLVPPVLFHINPSSPSVEVVCFAHQRRLACTTLRPGSPRTRIEYAGPEPSTDAFWIGLYAEDRYVCGLDSHHVLTCWSLDGSNAFPGRQQVSAAELDTLQVFQQDNVLDVLFHSHTLCLLDTDERLSCSRGLFSQTVDRESRRPFDLVETPTQAN